MRAHQDHLVRQRPASGDLAHHVGGASVRIERRRQGQPDTHRPAQRAQPAQGLGVDGGQGRGGNARHSVGVAGGPGVRMTTQLRAQRPRQVGDRAAPSRLRRTVPPDHPGGAVAGAVLRPRRWLQHRDNPAAHRALGRVEEAAPGREHRQFGLHACRRRGHGAAERRHSQGLSILAEQFGPLLTPRPDLRRKRLLVHVLIAERPQAPHRPGRGAPIARRAADPGPDFGRQFAGQRQRRFIGQRPLAQGLHRPGVRDRLRQGRGRHGEAEADGDADADHGGTPAERSPLNRGRAGRLADAGRERRPREHRQHETLDQP